MARSYSIGEQQALFNLPKPLDSSSGRVWAGPAYKSGSRRRKTLPEIVVAIDGESISLYDVQRHSLVASYALPPHTFLSAQPCSLHKKATSTSPPQRFTYLATQSGPAPSDHQTLCFREWITTPTHENPSLGSSPPSKTSFKLGSPEDPVISIQPMISPETGLNLDPEDTEVLLVQKSGRVTSVSPDVSFENWREDLGEPSCGSNASGESKCSGVKHVLVCSYADAAQGFFKAHTELRETWANRNQVTYNLNRCSLLCIVEESLTDDGKIESVTFKVLLIQGNKLPSAHYAPCKTLVRWKLLQQPSKSNALSSGKGSIFAFDAETGLLLRTTTDSLAVYNVSLPVPKLISQAPIPATGHSSCISISGKLFMIQTSSGYAIFDAYYQATYATTESFVLPQQQPGRKRKRDNNSGEQIGSELIQYLPRLKVVVMLSGTKLVCHPVFLASETSRGAHSGPGKVIDALSRGIPDLERRHPKSSISNEQHWADSLKHLEKTGAKQDLNEFEKTFFNILKTRKPLTEASLSEIVDCVVARIFAWSSQTTSSKKSVRLSSPAVKITFAPFGVLSWLIRNGELSAETVQRALKRSSPQAMNGICVRDQDIVVAVALSDPSSKLLLALIQDASAMSLDGLVHAIQLLLRSFDSPKILPSDRLLTDVDHQSPNAEGAEEELMLQDVAGRELDMAAGLLENGLKTRALALKVCLHKLAICFVSFKISEALRLGLDRRDIVLLVELIRFELTGGGWTSRHLDYYPDADAIQGSDEAIAAMCKLLNCATDALGASGWLLDAQSPGLVDETENMVSFLQDETTDVLEGVQECIFLQGFLKDFLRYEKLQNAVGRTKTPTEMPSRPVNQVGVESMLPLGSKAAPRISRTRIGAGGEIQKRSARDIANKLSQRLGSYTHESIQV